MSDRVVALIDMDCFYCQVEARLNPSLNGHPMAVIQYNEWKGGGIIAVNYEARDRGVTRFMRGDDAKQHCPEIILVSVPTVRGKADLTRYRDAGREVLSVFCRFNSLVQRASVDEAYIDLTTAVEERMKSDFQFDSCKWKSTFVVGYSKNSCNEEEMRQKGLHSWLGDCQSINNTASLKLAVGALIVEEMRQAVLSETGFKCSAGIAHNKILAKLACGLHKPNRQTILPLECVSGLYKTLPVKKIKNLGGKLGDDVVENLGCQYMSDLLQFSEKELQAKYDIKAGSWLFNIARGIDNEPVTSRILSKSIGCCKNFPGRNSLNNTKDVHHWISKLAEELSERLLEDEVLNKRRATLLTVSFHLEINKKDTSSSKSIALPSYDLDKIVTITDVTLRKVCKVDPNTHVWCPPIKYLGLSASKFNSSSNKILKFFKSSSNTDHSNIKKIESVEESTSLPIDDKSSFFLRMFKQDVSNSGKKVNIVPDFSKNDLYIDSEDSQGSIIKGANENHETPCEKQRENVKKNLFNTECDPAEMYYITNLKFETNSQKTSIKLSKSDSDKTNAIKKCSMENFLNKNFKQEEWVKPEELFPDMSEIDDELLESLPSTYKTKILKMQAAKLKKKVSTNDTSIVSEDKIPTSNYLELSNTLLDVVSSRNPENNDIASEVSSNTSDSSSKCCECGEIVSNYEEHKDMHFAINLDRQLNAEPISVHRINTKQVKENKRKSQASSKKLLPKNAKKVKSIDMFFRKRTS